MSKVGCRICRADISARRRCGRPCAAEWKERRKKRKEEKKRKKRKSFVGNGQRCRSEVRKHGRKVRSKRCRVRGAECGVERRMARCREGEMRCREVPSVAQEVRKEM